MNWPLLVRRICESYTGITPLQVEQMTLDQIYVLALDADLLKDEASGVRKMSYEEAVARGIVPESKESLVKKIRRQNEEKERQRQRDLRRARKADIRRRTRDARSRMERDRGETGGSSDGV